MRWVGDDDLRHHLVTYLGQTGLTLDDFYVEDLLALLEHDMDHQ